MQQKYARVAGFFHPATEKERLLLHLSALSAMEMKGRLTCFGPEPGQGATFTLEFPTAPPKES
jgi:hypothetical protein